METVVQKEFYIDSALHGRFNAWRITLGLTNADTSPPTATHEPFQLGQDLEHVMADQLALITGWRIRRFSRSTYLDQPFYIQARQITPAQQKVEEQEHKQRQEAIKLNRLTTAGPNTLSAPGVSLAGLPSYEPVQDQQQLREAAEEFRNDYQGWQPRHTSHWAVVDGALRHPVYFISEDQEDVEARQLRLEGERYAHDLFPEGTEGRGRNRSSSLVQRTAVVALFDDHVHDSRAWFLHSAFGTREFFGDYLRYRTVFFGDYCNKRLIPVAVAGRMVGIDPLASARYGIRLDNWRGFVDKLPDGAIGYKVIDLDTGEVEPFLRGAAQSLQPTHRVGVVVAQQRQMVVAAEDAQRTRNVLAEIERQRGRSSPVAESLS